MTNSDFHRSAATEEALPEWEDPRVQTVYELLCAHLVPPGDEHWEGFVARHIVRALSSDGEPSNGKQPLMASRPAPPVPSDAILSLKDEVRGAVARGWCSSDNEHKEMDVDLADSIFAEVWAEVAAHVHTFDVAQAAQEPNEAEIEAWIRILDTEQSRNLVMWRDRALRAERELSEANGKMFAALTAQPPADPVETEEGNYDRSNSEAVAWIAFAGNGNIRLWTADEARAKDEKSRGLDMRAFTLAELVALASKAPTRSSAGSDLAKVADWLDDQARIATNSLHCGDNSAMIQQTHDWADKLETVARLIRNQPQPAPVQFSETDVMVVTARLRGLNALKDDYGQIQHEKVRKALASLSLTRPNSRSGPLDTLQACTCTRMIQEAHKPPCPLASQEPR